MKSKKTLSTLIALLLSGFFLWLTFRKIDFGQLIASFKAINWLWSIPFIVVTWISFYWRAWRWQKLLEPTRRLSVRELYGPMMLGFAFNSIFPARAGEFARPYALTKTSGVPFPTGISTVVVERICDILMLLGLFLLTPYLVTFKSGFSEPYDGRMSIPGSTLVPVLYGTTVVFGLLVLGGVAWWYLHQRRAMAAAPYMNEARTRKLTTIGIVVVLLVAAAVLVLVEQNIDPARTYEFGAVVDINAELLESTVKKTSILAAALFVCTVLMLFDWFQNLVQRIVMGFPLLPHGLRKKLSGLFESVALGFQALRRPSLLAQIALHTIGIWVLTGFSFQVMSWGVPGIDLSLPYSMVFLVVTCVVITVPAAPGYWGLYELGGLLALVLCQVVPNTTEGRTQAMSYTLVVHFIQWALVTVIGLYYAGRIHVSVGDAQAATSAESNP